MRTRLLRCVVLALIGLLMVFIGQLIPVFGLSDQLEFGDTPETVANQQFWNWIGVLAIGGGVILFFSSFLHLICGLADESQTTISERSSTHE